MSRARLRQHGVEVASALLCASVVTLVPLSASPRPPGAQTPGHALPAGAGGGEVYRVACATCHGSDGRGASRASLGFDSELPDFAECAFASAEPDPDWYAIVHEGGPIRALGREMPAFGATLTGDQIRLALGHIRSFCAERSWPRGDLDLPLPFFTEKAFPENEVVWTTAFVTGERGGMNNELAYERRVGARNQIEIKAPIDFRYNSEAGPGAPWAKGLGDVAIGVKRTLAASMRTGTIVAAGVEVMLPTGNEHTDLGEGTVRYEPFAMFGQVLPHDSFLQVHGGIEVPAEPNHAAKEAYLRAALGTTVAQDRGFGRAWSPQVEVLWARAFGGVSEWDVVPQFQVSLSRLQHVLIAAGLRVPITQRGERRPQALVYLQWDWFDGGLFDHWK